MNQNHQQEAMQMSSSRTLNSNVSGNAITSPPAPMASQPQQDLMNAMVHPALQQIQFQAQQQQQQQQLQYMQHSSNRTRVLPNIAARIDHLKSLPGGTVVKNFPLQQQSAPTPDMTKPQGLQNIKPFSHFRTNSSNQAVGNSMNNNSFPLMSRPSQNPSAMPLQEGIPASSINVTTASYSAPVPQGRSKDTNSKECLSKTSSAWKQNQVKLATVPTRKLASRSIISFDQNFGKQSNDSTTSSSTVKSTTQAASNVSGRLPNQPQKTNAQQQDGALFFFQNKAPTSQQVEQRKNSSYSSACDATILAQQNLSRDASSSISQDHDQFRNGRDSATPSDDGENLSGAVVGSPAAIGITLPSKRESPCADENEEHKHKYVKVVGGKVAEPLPSPSKQTLQEYFGALITSRGYSNQHFCSLEGGYYCKPTELQKASYGMKLIQAVRNSDGDSLRELLGAGLSPNPCNAFGESIIHMVCRRGDYKLLKIFLDHGCSVQVSDDFGRTPLHDACWTTKPCFKSVELLLNKDRRLLHIVDCRGAAPLSYVKKNNWGEWMEFFDRQKDIWWSKRDVNEEGEEGPPALSLKSPHSLPLPDPPNAIICDHAKLLANGTMKPENIDQIPKNQEPVGDGSIIGRSAIATN